MSNHLPPEHPNIRRPGEPGEACTRTPGCPKPSGHSGFCVGHPKLGGGTRRGYDPTLDDPDWDPLADPEPDVPIVTPAAIEKARVSVMGKTAAAQAATIPRHGPIVQLSAQKAKIVEGLTDSKVRTESAKAELAETELEMKKLDLATQRGSLVRVEDCRMLVEEAHLQWRARLDKLGEMFAKKLADSELGVHVHFACKDLLDMCITDMCEAVAKGEEP